MTGFTVLHYACEGVNGGLGHSWRVLLVRLQSCLILRVRHAEVFYFRKCKPKDKTLMYIRQMERGRNQYTEWKGDTASGKADMARQVEGHETRDRRRRDQGGWRKRGRVKSAEPRKRERLFGKVMQRRVRKVC